MNSGQLAVCALLTVITPTSAFAGGAIVLVRHAERADQAPGHGAAMAADPDLSPAGRARAESLAMTLQDAGITAIFVTEYKRTQQTAEPLANALKLPVQVVDARDVEGLVTKVKAAPGAVLVVGHSNTVPEAMKALGVETDLSIPDSEYDNLFIVGRGSPKPVMIRLRYR